MTRTNLEMWLLETDGPTDQSVTGLPTTDPYAGSAVSANAQPGPDPNAALKGPDVASQGPDAKSADQPNDDITKDPRTPDIGDDSEAKDFEDWKTDFFKLAQRGDVMKMLDSIGEVRDQNLGPSQRKFVEDNLQILLFRQDANIDKASKEIRKLIKQELDRNSPAVTVMQHITNTLEAYPLLNNIFIKLVGLYALKGDLHRKFLGALTGSVQVGGAGDKEDLIYPETDYSINFSTRMYPAFGRVTIGWWTPEENDPEKYLSDTEQDRLEDGSPEEKAVLRHRMMIESIAERFRTRAFLMHIVDPSNGSIHVLGWDLAESIRNGYKSGKLVLRPKTSSFREAGILDDGTIVPINDLSILYAKDSDELDSTGGRRKELKPFMERQEGKLYLTASLDTLEELSASMLGLFYKQIPYQGNPSDLKTLMRCIPSSLELLFRRC